MHVTYAQKGWSRITYKIHMHERTKHNVIMKTHSDESEWKQDRNEKKH